MSFFGTGANRLTPGGSNPIPRGFSQWPESERLQYASKNGWFNEHEDYLANRPFVANVQFISESSTEYHGLMREFNEFRRNRKELEEKLLNIPTYSTPYMCPKKLHVESITTLLNFCTSIIFQVPTDDDDEELLREMREDAWSLIAFIPVLYLGDYTNYVRHSNPNKCTYASRKADAATDLVGLGPDWVDIIRQNLDRFLEMAKKRVSVFIKQDIKNGKNTPGFNSLHSGSQHSRSSSQSSSQSELLETVDEEQGLELMRKENRESVRKRTSDRRYSASDQVKKLLTSAYVPRNKRTLDSLKELVGMDPVNDRDEEAREIVRRCADAVRDSIYITSRETYDSIARSPSKASGDITGLRNSHLQALSRSVSSPAVKVLSLLFETIARADHRICPSQNNGLYCTSILVPIAKPGASKTGRIAISDVRPIAVPNCIFKRVENMLCHLVKTSAVKFLNPTVIVKDDSYNKITQNSFGIKAGSSKASRRVNDIMKIQSDWVTVQIDCKNAFGSVDIDHMYQCWAEIAQSPADSTMSELKILLPYVESRYDSKQILKMYFDDQCRS
jgi:hypothetical protein